MSWDSSYERDSNESILFELLTLLYGMYYEFFYLRYVIESSGGGQSFIAVFSNSWATGLPI